jgi:short-subunit dehydrogenase
MYVICDFSKISTIEEYQSTVADKLINTDIGVLVLNAGTNVMGPFKDLRNDEVERIVNVNAVHVIYVAKTLLP